jgi:ABC-type antimicrobial peptide transport system permease subunit
MVALTAVSPAGRVDVPLGQGWLPDSTDLIFSPPNSDGSGSGFVVYSDTAEVMLTPSYDGGFNDRITPPVVVSQQLADVFDIGVGDTITFALQDGLNRMDGEIVSVVPAIPGAPTNIALLIDLGVIQHFQLRTTEQPAQVRDVWVRSDEPEAVARAIRAFFPANAQIDTAGDSAGRQVLGSATTALWAGAVGCGILALIGVAVAARAQLRSRRGEVAVLRAVGLGSRAQAGIRARELGVVIGTGLLAGLGAGTIVALLTVPQLARAAIPAPYPVIGT